MYRVLRAYWPELMTLPCILMTFVVIGVYAF